MSGARRRRLLASLAALGLVAAPSCVKRGYPLSPTGSVEVIADVAGALFATDTLDASGKPAGPRQTPYATGVSLTMVEGNQAAYGAIVEVRIEPSQALTLKGASESEGTAGPTCFYENGIFRCLANPNGAARFEISSDGTWSGQAKIIVSWADQKKELPITVLPAGLPAEATNFALLVGGVGTADRVLATNIALTCTLDAVPADLGSKWRDGQIRWRQAFVRASAPSASPGAVENAPVIVESLAAEGQLALTQACADRTTRLRLLLGATGESPPFYICFSDIGGPIAFGVSSGAKVIDPPPHVDVDPEPRLLRVRTLATHVGIGLPVDMFEITAYNADRVRVSIPVDVKITNDTVLKINQASVTLADESNLATVIQAQPMAVGTAQLQVSPRLLTTPKCLSDIVQVVPSPTP